MTVKKKKVPPWLRNRFLVWLYQSKIGILFSNWASQCLLYAEPIEVLFKLSLEFSVFLLLMALASTVTRLTLLVVVIAALVAHTTTFIVNGQLFVLWRFIGKVRTDPKTFIEYAGTIGNRLEKRQSIRSVLMFGSLTRDRFSESSDLDVRVISDANFLAGFIACFWVFLERFMSLLKKYPLDIYVVNEFKGLEKLRNDEPPVVLFDKNSFVPMQYAEYDDYKSYKQRFLQKYCFDSKTR
jgi:L-malate glycosyltransferase